MTETPGGIDLVLAGGRVHTLDAGSSVVEALAVRGDRVVAVGSSSDVSALAGEGTRVVDLGGRSVVPGLIDAHTHLELSAQARHFFHDVRGLSRREVLERVGDLVSDAPSSEWLVLQGTFGQDLPSRPELDAVSPSRPVALRWTMHRVVVNSEGLRASGLLDGGPPPVGARLERGSDGELTGVLDEGWDLLGWRPPEGRELAEALSETLASQYLVHGVTSVYEVLASREALRQYRLLARAGELPVRVRAVATLPPGHQPTAELAGLESLGTALGLGSSETSGDSWVGLAGVKIFLDGGRHAAFRSSELAMPVASWGLLTRTPTMLAHEVARGIEADLQVWVHAIGDLSQRIAVGAVSEALRSLGPVDHRTRIEHLGNELYEPVELARAAELGIVAVPNPTFLFAEPDDPADRLPPGVEKYALRTLRRAGFRPPGNSDTAGAQPFATSPWFGMSCMTRRRNRNEVEVSPGERLSFREAIGSYTGDAAVAGFEEEEKGSIEVGKLADLAVVSSDPFKSDGGDPMEVRCLATIVGGRLLYLSDELAGSFPP